MTGISVKNCTVDFPIFTRKRNPGGRLLLNLFQPGKAERVTVLREITLDLRVGDRVALLGANGAGKTTLLKVLSEILPPTTGTVTRKGSIFPVIRLSNGLIDQATCLQNIAICGTMYGLHGESLVQYIEQVTDISGLQRFINTPLSALSSGMRSRLIVSTLSVMKAEIVVMDEWIGVADKKLVSDHGSTLENLVDSCKVFVLASHRENIVRHYCNRTLVLDGGTVVYDGDVDGGFQLFK